MSDSVTLLSLAAAVTTVGTAILTLWKLKRTASKDKEEQEAKILQQAKEEDNALRLELKAEIEALKTANKNLKDSFDKDIDHLRETHSGEIANLSEKIEQLRDELRDRHSKMIELLSKLIDSR